MTKKQFIAEIAKYVAKHAPKYNIKVYSPIIAQAILESASGTSELARNAHNYFGLKYNPKQPNRCPSAIGIYTKIGSEQNKDGTYVSSSMLWQKFNSIEDCVIGYLDFCNVSWYSNIKNVTDPETYLKNIKADGYATSLNYVKNLMNVIKENNLTQYDPGVSTTKAESKDVLYRVQCGAYTIETNAVIMQNRLAALGFDAFVTQVGNLYKVQVGAYSEKVNAEAMIAKLRTRGITGVIVGDVKEQKKENTETSIITPNIEGKVAIDAGHGSDTAGKRTPDNYKEHWINVMTAYYCEQFLQKHGVETVRIAWDDMDATDDPDVALTVRQRQIKNENCKIAVSIHANAFGSGWNKANGVETLIHNNVSYQRDSLALANMVQTRIIKGTPQTNRGVKKQTLAMCNCPAMDVEAACLVEIGFMTNEHEAELMKTHEFCKEQGEDIAKGILDYLKVSVKNVFTPIVSVETNKTKEENENYSYTDFVKEIQTILGVKVDGKGGPETLSKTITISKIRNNRHAIVKPIQKYLNSLGYDCGKADGIAGVKFDKAVKAFQKDNKCVIDGEITAKAVTWKILLKM